MYLGFILFRYGKMTDMEKTVFQRSLLLTIPKGKERGKPCRVTWRGTRVGQEAEGMTRKQEPEATVVFAGRNGQSRVGKLNRF